MLEDKLLFQTSHSVRYRAVHCLDLILSVVYYEQPIRKRLEFQSSMSIQLIRDLTISVIYEQPIRKRLEFQSSISIQLIRDLTLSVIYEQPIRKRLELPSYISHQFNQTLDIISLL